MKIRVLKSGKGVALVTVVAITLILTILGFSVLNMVNSEILLAKDAVSKTKAFYLAEAGIELFNAQLNDGVNASIGETILGEGSYQVTYVPGANPPYAISTGTINGQEKRIKVTVSFLAPPFECGVYAGGMSGDGWTLLLRGQGNPTPQSGGEVGGKDIVNGNIFVDGDVALYEESSVRAAPLPNTYGLAGDVEATGNVNVYDSASIAGDVNEGLAAYGPPDLVGMNYAINNTHNVSQIFADAGINQGYLPFGHELRNVFVKNPADRNAECATTTGNDYFFEPSTGFIGGSWDTAPTPLHAGENRVYYIDGDLWVHSKNDTFGFNMDGKVTIVVTGDIHVSDNLKYADTSSMLGLVALGKYDGNGDLISGGNVYFGDPTYGTMYTFSAMMFAANNFLFNSTAPDGAFAAEPESGFTVNGSFAALNKVSVERDWYDKWNGYTYVAKPARYNSDAGEWVDSVTGTVLTSTEISTLRHYQMIVNYDERVRSQSTQPPGLPRGTGGIFEGLCNWEELP